MNSFNLRFDRASRNLLIAIKILTVIFIFLGRKMKCVWAKLSLTLCLKV
jgi:hypothetical protein